MGMLPVASARAVSQCFMGSLRANKLAKAKAIVNNSFIHRCGISFSKISLIFTIMAGIRIGRREVIVRVDGNCFYRAMAINK